MLKKFFRADKGFSLVELLVAITILGIASAAVAHSFITASNITKRSKSFGEATAAAENIAEAVDAFSVEKFLSGNASQMLDVTASEGTDNQVFKQDNRNVAITGITSGSETYDAVINFAEGDHTAELDSDDYGIYELNNYEIAQYTEMDGSFTQSYMDGQNPDILADVAFQDEAAEMHGIYDSATDQYKFNGKNRLITVNVYTDSTDNIYMDVIYNYTYVYTYHVYAESVDTGTTAQTTFVYTWTGSVSFNQNDSSKYSPTEGNEEPSVFIMYYPYYDSKKYAGFERWSQYEIDSERTNMTDSYYDLSTLTNLNYNSAYGSYKGKDLIVINNLGNVPTKFFIVKQRLVDSGAAVENSYFTSRGYENASYRACILERLSDSSLLTNKNANTVYTNAGVSLINDTVFGTFTGYKIVNAAGTTITAYLNTNNEVDYLKKDLVNVEAEPRYYKVTIDVYPAGTVTHELIDNDDEEAEKLYTIGTGESGPIYSFVGSKLE